MHDAFKMVWISHVYDKISRNLRSRKNFATRRTSSRLGKLFARSNLSGIFGITICYRSPTIDSFRRSSRLSCIVFRCDWAGDDAFTRIFLDPRRCVTAGSNILSASRLIYPTDQEAGCKLSLRAYFTNYYFQI